MAKRKKFLVAISLLVVVTATATLSINRPSAAVPVARFEVPATGKVTQLLVKNGDVVTQGQVLADLDPTPYEEELKEDEAELKQLQADAQMAIQPISGFGAPSGLLPRQIPVTETIRVPVKAAKKPDQVKPQKGLERPQKDELAKAADHQKAAASDLDKATQSLAKATADLVDAQKARDAMRIKATQANAAATQAARKAADVGGLLSAGVISANRAKEIAAENEAAKRTAKAVQDEVKAADKTLQDAQNGQQKANETLEQARKDVSLADTNLVKANMPGPPVAPKPAKSEPTKAVKPVEETRIVTRHMPLIRLEEPPAIPVKVSVDEKAMQNSEQRIPALLKRIAELKAIIASCHLVAPVSGEISISPNGGIVILV